MPEITNPKMDALRARAEALDIQKRAPIPTPEIGRIVWFYRHGDMTQTPVPGCVVGHGGPGQLDLKLFVRNSQNQENVTGIHWSDHPFVRSNPEVIKLRSGGVWTYRLGDKPTEAHKEAHITQIEQMLKNIQNELVRERGLQIARDATDKELRQPKGEKVTSG